MNPNEPRFEIDPNKRYFFYDRYLQHEEAQKKMKAGFVGIEVPRLSRYGFARKEVWQEFVDRMNRKYGSVPHA